VQAKIKKEDQRCNGEKGLFQISSLPEAEERDYLSCCNPTKLKAVKWDQNKKSSGFFAWERDTF